MIHHVTLHNFKNFRKATLHLGPFSVLVGANASGKSNLRDAFRFLHGVGRGYTLAETFGEKYVEGALQWRGLRGTLGEMAFWGTARFQLEAELDIASFTSEPTLSDPVSYRIEVVFSDDAEGNTKAHVAREALYCGGDMLFASEARGAQVVKVTVKPGGNYRKGQVERFAASRPVLTQIGERVAEKRDDDHALRVRQAAKGVANAFQAMRFLDLHPDAMRQPSVPGQTTLSDRGENLSSVLEAICEKDRRKAALVDWMQMLTPMDAVDLRFPSDLSGKTLAVLVEPGGRETTLYSASDGTLRFLAIAAALLGPSPDRFYFIEEIENGIHPTRLDLLLELIEQNVEDHRAQVVATTHSPSLLRLMPRDTLQDASLVFRLEDAPDAHIRRILKIPEAQRILETQDIARLFESGWMENSMAFTEASSASEQG